MPTLSAGVFCMPGKAHGRRGPPGFYESMRTIEDGEIRGMSGNQLRLPADGGNQLST